MSIMSCWCVHDGLSAKQDAHEENEEGNEEAATIAEGNDHMTADKGNSTLVGLVESIPGPWWGSLHG